MRTVTMPDGRRGTVVDSRHVSGTSMRPECILLLVVPHTGKDQHPRWLSEGRCTHHNEEETTP